jgi:hypothetical protein
MLPPVPINKKGRPMCSACGFPAVPGHWTEAGASSAHERLRGRMRRAQVLKRVLPAHGLTVHEGGEIPGIQVSTLSGSQSILTHLDELWALAEKVGGAPVDPLDPRFIGDE